VLKGYGISLAEFRGYSVKIPEDPEKYARKGSRKKTW
jgi:hypothetical protein